MSAIPLARPFAWTQPGFFFLQVDSFCVEIGSDCLRHQRFIR